MRVMSVECAVSCCERGARRAFYRRSTARFRGWVHAIIGGTEHHCGLRESCSWATAAAAASGQ
jgi:hypothetical protein